MDIRLSRQYIPDTGMACMIAGTLVSDKTARCNNNYCSFMFDVIQCHVTIVVARWMC